MAGDKRVALTHGSLFSGIGGIDLGFERAGIKTVWQVESEPFARQVLRKRFRSAKLHGDIRECHGLSVVDVISGGFPCTGFSRAGKREGYENEGSALWGEMSRIIREVRPKYVVVENVAALCRTGIGRVLGELSEGGYDAEWRCFSAYDFGLPHTRSRVVIIGYLRSKSLGVGIRWDELFTPQRCKDWKEILLNCRDGRTDGISSRLDLLKALNRADEDRCKRRHVIGGSVVVSLFEYIGRLVVDHAVRAAK